MGNKNQNPKQQVQELEEYLQVKTGTESEDVVADLKTIIDNHFSSRDDRVDQYAMASIMGLSAAEKCSNEQLTAKKAWKLALAMEENDPRKV